MDIKNTNSNKLKIWECALLAAVCITLLSGLWASAAQEKLSGELVRLHVVAESDSERDQAVKLKVRDAVVSYLSLKLEDTENIGQAKTVIEKELDNLEAAARAAAVREGTDCSVSVTMETEAFPTREYDSFALPAGDYVSLRVTLGDGAGQNWWCVVFPPLCVSSVESEEAFGELSEENSRIIKTEDSEYRLKFHIIEFFQKIKLAFS